MIAINCQEKESINYSNINSALKLAFDKRSCDPMINDYTPVRRKKAGFKKKENICITSLNETPRYVKVHFKVKVLII